MTLAHNAGNGKTTKIGPLKSHPPKPPQFSGAEGYNYHFNSNFGRNLAPRPGPAAADA